VFSKTKVKSQMQKRLKCITVLPSGINEFEENFIKGGVQILMQYKQNLIAEHDGLDILSENQPLYQEDRQRMKHTIAKINKI
jgi:hypothetical protein